MDERDKSIIEKGFYDQAKLLKPFVNFYQLQQSQKYLNKEWNEMNMDDRYKKIQKERDQDDVIRNFKPEPAYDMLPINTRCHKIDLNNPNRTTLGSTKGMPFKNIYTLGNLKWNKNNSV